MFHVSVIDLHYFLYSLVPTQQKYVICLLQPLFTPTYSFCYFPLIKFEINKKRDAELAKLRRLLEDVHLESEETAAQLRKKHQEAIGDYQDQLDQLAKARQKYVSLSLK